MAERLEATVDASLLPCGCTQLDWSQVYIIIASGGYYCRSVSIFEVDISALTVAPAGTEDSCLQLYVVKGVGLGILNYSPSAGLFDRHVLARPVPIGLMV